MDQIKKFSREKEKIEQKFSVIGGCDEVGRGPLAGSVVACVVVFDEKMFNAKHSWTSEVRDSKKLSEKKRKELSEIILESAVACSIGEVSHVEIDSINIHNATLLAMRRALENVSHENFFLFVDGKFVISNVTVPQEAVVHGDDTIFSVACASIVAKVYRDAQMEKLHELFPEYNFFKNKGYGTGEHIAAIRKYGLTPMHRTTFCTNFVSSL